MTRIPLSWTVGFTNDPHTEPETFVPAVVPGAVQLDWAAAHNWPPYTYADNWRDYGWMEDVFWLYRTVLDLPPLAPDQRLVFVSKGIDYRFQIRHNGRVLHEQEGMFTPVEIDVTDLARSGGVFDVFVFPAPKSRAAPADRSQADQCCKPAVSYGWDWHPRLVPLGIWDDTYLEVRPRLHLRDAEVAYALADDLAAAEVTLHAALSGAGGGQLHWSLQSPNGDTVVTQTAPLDTAEIVLRADIASPELWWPNGEGAAALYLSRVELRDGDGGLLQVEESRVGFRRVALVMHPGAWQEPSGFPKSRSNPPITLEINGRRIFCKGSNWVNPEIFPGIITADTYRPLLQMARDAHMNLLRVWGGGIVNKDSFFDLCDEMGLMVWQEFPLACNNYRGTPGYLRVLDQESRSILRRLRRRACLAIWCGGNELFNAWSGMTDQSLALRLLNRNCYDLDPHTPFLMTSPLMGMAHGNYLFRYHDGREVFQAMPGAANTAYTEFGCPGPSPADYLRTFIPPDDLFPPRPGTAWETHHAFGAWGDTTWLLPDVIEDYFGPGPDLETLVERGQWLQNEGYKCIFEEGRRQKPVCSMVLNWCYNEPWPSAANNSLINWPARPKPAYHAVAAACRPTLASARIPKFSWKAGEPFCPELWILHDDPAPLPGGRLDAYLRIGDEEILLLGWDFPTLEPNTNHAGPIVRFPLPQRGADRLSLLLRVAGRPELDSEYVLAYRPEQKPPPIKTTPTLNV